MPVSKEFNISYQNICKRTFPLPIYKLAVVSLFSVASVISDDLLQINNADLQRVLHYHVNQRALTEKTDEI